MRARSGTMPSSSSSYTVRRYISVVSISSLTRPLCLTGGRARAPVPVVPWSRSRRSSTVPLRSGNGGYVCGLLGRRMARRLDRPSSRRTLLQPPPLDTTLTWEEDDDVDELRLVTAGGAMIGTAVTGSFDRDPPPVSRADAEASAGAAAYPGFTNHPFDHCFTCGTKRGEGDGLRIFAARCADDRTATAWSPHAAFAEPDGASERPVAWAGLDCPGGWAADFAERPMVLGRMTGQVLRRPRPGEELFATGRLDEHTGRKFLTSTALYTRDGELIGRAEQTWIQIDIADFV